MAVKKLDLRAGYGITHTLEETAQLMDVTRERPLSQGGVCRFAKDSQTSERLLQG